MPHSPTRYVSPDFPKKKAVYHPIHVDHIQLQIPQACFADLAIEAGFHIPELDPTKYYRGLDGIPDLSVLPSPPSPSIRSQYYKLTHVSALASSRSAF